MNKKVIIIISIAVAVILALIVLLCVIMALKSLKASDSDISLSVSSDTEEYNSGNLSDNSIAESGASSDTPIQKDEANGAFLCFVRPTAATVDSSEQTFIFTGSCAPDIKLTVNGKSVECNNDGSFLYNAQLSKGKNTFVFKQGGVTKSFTVNYKPVSVSVGTTTNSDKKNEASGIEPFVYHYRDALGHTYKKLTEDKELTVVYYGGSVTAGYGASKGYGNAEGGTSWACLLTNWLKNQFKGAKINAYNSSIGATGTNVGVYRLKEDVLRYNPDLVFVEFAINDHYCGESGQATAAQFETLVREIRTAAPKCDIVTVLTTDSYTIKLSELYATAAAHEVISEHYGISSVNVGQYVWEKMGKNDFKWSDYFIDIVHPNDTGYFEYGVCLSSFLEKQLLKTDYSGFKDADKPLKPIKSSYLFDGDRTAKMGEELKSVLIKSDTKSFNWKSGLFDGGADCTHNGYYITNSLNSQISFEFSGTELSIWTNLRGTSKLKYSVDGGEWKEIYCVDNSPSTVVRGLKSGNHTIKIVPTDFGSGKSDFKIHAIFTRDATKQTKK